ncbi:transposase [Micromonospora sp. NPDC049801]
MARLWIGVDIGKTHHHVATVDGDGRLVYSRRVANDETPPHRHGRGVDV